MITKADTKYEAIVVGTSAGGLHSLNLILQGLPKDYSTPVIVVQHRSKDQKGLLEDVLQSKSVITIKQADEKEHIKSNTVYIAPPDYHLLIEKNKTFSLSSEEQVKYSRPSIDVLFESAATVYKEKLVGIILSGANDDGANGVSTIKRNGGLTIAQNPSDAQFPFMPSASIATERIDHIMTLEQIKNFLLTINTAK